MEREKSRVFLRSVGFHWPNDTALHAARPDCMGISDLFETPGCTHTHILTITDQLIAQCYILCIRCYMFRPSISAILRELWAFSTCRLQHICQLLYTEVADFPNTLCTLKWLPGNGRDSRPKHVGANTTNVKLCNTNVCVCNMIARKVNDIRFFVL